MLSAPVLVLRSVKKTYCAGLPGCLAKARALNAVNLEVRRGEVIALVGPSGAGKTTLLRCAGGLLAADEGCVEHTNHSSGAEGAVRYFADPLQAVPAQANQGPCDVALVDDADKACGDVTAAFALVRLIERARRDNTALVLAAREPRVLRDLVDRIVSIERGRVDSEQAVALPPIARVAEHAAPLKVSPGRPSIR